MKFLKWRRKQVVERRGSKEDVAVDTSVAEVDKAEDRKPLFRSRIVWVAIVNILLPIFSHLLGWSDLVVMEVAEEVMQLDFVDVQTFVTSVVLIVLRVKTRQAVRLPKLRFW